MWGLLVAAFVGVFSSMFNLSPSAGMSRYDVSEVPTYRQEYDKSYFDEGFQTNQESGNNKTVGNSLQSSVEPQKVQGVYIYPREDSSSARSSENDKNDTSGMTVLSGEDS